MMRSTAYVLLIVLTATFSLVAGCGGGSSLDSTLPEDDVSTLTGTNEEIAALTRAIEDAEAASIIAMDPTAPLIPRIKAMHIWLLLAGMGRYEFKELRGHVLGVVKELEQVALNQEETEEIRTTALDLVHVGKAMYSLNIANPALFVGYTTNWLPSNEGLVSVPEAILQQTLAPDECTLVVEKIRGLKAVRVVVRDVTGKVRFRTLWIPVEIIKSLKWCRNGTEPPTLVTNGAGTAEDDLIYTVQQPSLMNLLMFFQQW